MFGLLVGAVSFSVLILKEENFKVGTEYLIVQNNTNSQDFYTLSKSAEYVGRILNEGVYSELFINEVVKTGKVNSEFLPFDKKDRLEEWGKSIQISRNPDLGIMSIEVLNDNQKQAVAISEAISEVLTMKNHLFRGNMQDIDVRVLSGPVSEKNPSVGNLVSASVGGFVLGVLLAMLWIVYKNDKQAKKSSAGGSFVVNSNPLDRMANSGNFMNEQEYQETLRNMDGR